MLIYYWYNKPENVLCYNPDGRLDVLQRFIVKC